MGSKMCGFSCLSTSLGHPFHDLFPCKLRIPNPSCLMGLLETLKKRQISLPKSLSLRDKALSTRLWSKRERDRDTDIGTERESALTDNAAFLGSHGYGGKGVPHGSCPLASHSREGACGCHA